MSALVLAAAVLAQAHVPLESLLPTAEPSARRAAFKRVAAARDARYIAPLLDLLSLADTREEWFLVLDTLSPLAGRDMRAVDRPWRTLSSELARGSAPELPPGAWTFKGSLYSARIDATFERFFEEAPSSAIRIDQVAFGGVPVDGIPALTDPDFDPAADAPWLADDAAVVGLHLGGEARAYPLAIIDWHELVNDVVGGVPVALSWCTLCGAAIPYRAERDGERLLFGSSGLLHRSNKLMFDRGTDSLWDQLAGQPVAGPRRGEAPLERLPIRVTTWGAWRAEHPRTTVLSRRTGHERTYAEGAAYGDYFASPDTMFAVAHTGTDPKELVAVLASADGPVAVRIADLRSEPEGAVELTVDRRDVTLRAHPKVRRPSAAWDAATGGAFERATPQLLRAAWDSARNSAAPLPPLTAEDVLALSPATRRAVLDPSGAGIPLADGARARAASRALAADVEASTTDKHGAAVEVPVHLAFRFAVDQAALDRAAAARARRSAGRSSRSH